MSNYSISIKIKSFLALIRFNQPAGFMLLMWPCWFALAHYSNNILDNLKWYFFFFIGSFLMRSAGCIINDIVDIKIDRKIERTSKRPLVVGNLSIFEAVTLLIILLCISLLVLIQFNNKTIVLGLLSFPIIILYPFMKRHTYWPQLMLGIIFNWGILIVSLQFEGYLSITYIGLYLGCIFWTLGYDTIYAYQDRADDIKNNIKSTAVLFGNMGKKYVISFYTIFLTILGFISFNTSKSINSIFFILLIFFTMIFFLNKWKLDSITSSNNFFKLNNILGLSCFIYLINF